MPFRASKGDWLSFASVVTPPLVIFVFPMLGVIARNAEYFGGDYSAGVYVYAAGAAYLALGITSYLLRRTSAGALLLLAYLLTAPAALLHSVGRAATGSMWLTAATIIALAFATNVLRRRAMKGVLEGFGLFGTLVVLGMGANTAYTFATAESPGPLIKLENREAEATQGAKLPNIYHLILDEFQTDLFELALDASLREELSGFTYFHNATTPYGRTEMALASIFGLEDYAYDVPPLDFIKSAYADPRAPLRQLEAAGYRTTGYIHQLALYGNQAPFQEVHLHSEVAGGKQPGHARLAASVWTYAVAPELLAEALLPAHHYKQLAGRVLLPDDAPPISVASFEAFLSAEESRDPFGRYANVHLLLPHFPHVLTADCSYRPDGSRPMDQVGCAITVIKRLLAELRSLDRFDDSMIIIQGDHGAAYRVVDGNLENTEAKGSFSEEFSFARSRPLLLIKPPGRSDRPLQRSERPVSLSDLMPTIFDQVDLPLASGAGRVSVFATEFPERPIRHYHFYEKGPRIVSGELRRYEIGGGRARLERAIALPRFKGDRSITAGSVRPPDPAQLDLSLLRPRIREGAVKGWVELVRSEEGLTLSGWAVRTRPEIPADLAAAFAGTALIGSAYVTRDRGDIVTHFGNSDLMATGFAIRMSESDWQRALREGLTVLAIAGDEVTPLRLGGELVREMENGRAAQR